jgi:fumarate reductase flavoprotein subunit
MQYFILGSFLTAIGASPQESGRGGSQVSEDVRYDIAVIGGGGAGLAAAVSAREHGASVIVVEAAGQVGGSTALSGGAFLAAGTAVQRAAGQAGDSAGEFYDYFLAVNRWDVEPSIVRHYCDEGAAAIDWLTRHGVEFPVAELARGELERVPRMHRAAGGGAGIIAGLKRSCDRLGVDIALGTRADALMTGDDGVVHGIRAGGQELTAGAVVITTGGFANNRELVGEHIDSVRPVLDLIRTPAPETNQGDGLRMALDAGAATDGANRAQLLLSAGLTSDIEPVLPGWLICVDGTGRRFVDETANYHVINPLTQKHGGVCWAVFDDVARARAKGSGSRFGAGMWTSDILTAAASEGRITAAADLDGLARSIGVPPGTLRTTVRTYNADCELGADSLFGKKPAAMVPCGTPPFYAVALRPVIMPVTGYGLRIDADTRVLRASDNQPIPGLFAAGEVVGNVVGPHVFSGGAMIAAAIIFGRRAGAVIASLVEDQALCGAPEEHG